MEKIGDERRRGLRLACPIERPRTGDEFATAGPFDQWGIARLRAAATREDIFLVDDVDDREESV